MRSTWQCINPTATLDSLSLASNNFVGVYIIRSSPAQRPTEYLQPGTAPVPREAMREARGSRTLGRQCAQNVRVRGRGLAPTVRR